MSKCFVTNLKGSVALVELVLRLHKLLEDAVPDAASLPDGELLRCVVEGEDGESHAGTQLGLLGEIECCYYRSSSI